MLETATNFPREVLETVLDSQEQRPTPVLSRCYCANWVAKRGVGGRLFLEFGVKTLEL